MRIACFSPLPPQKSGIADYTRELLPELRAAGAAVDLWVAANDPEPRGVEGFPIVRYEREGAVLARLHSYDSLLYHLGNDAAYHAELFSVFCRYPGVVVLHDLVLHHFMYEFLRRRGAAQDYARELESAHGEAGRAFALRVLAGDPTAALSSVDAEHLPLHQRVLDIASGLIVHSDYALRLVRSGRPVLPLAKIHHFGPPLTPSADPAALRQRYGLPAKALIVASFGHFVAAKRVDVALRALSALGFLRRRRVHYLLVGQAADDDLLRQARALGLAPRVHFVPWVDLEMMNDYLRLCDIVINLRHPTMGETSGVACRALAAGKACVVSDTGWFSELADDVVIKIGVGANEERDLTAVLRSLIDDADGRRELGERARRFSMAHHSPRRVARAYLEFLAVAAQPAEPLRLALQDEVAGALAAWGVQAGDEAVLAALEATLDRLFHPPAGGSSGAVRALG